MLNIIFIIGIILAIYILFQFITAILDKVEIELQAEMGEFIPELLYHT